MVKGPCLREWGLNSNPQNLQEKARPSASYLKSRHGEMGGRGWGGLAVWWGSSQWQSPSRLPLTSPWSQTLDTANLLSSSIISLFSEGDFRDPLGRGLVYLMVHCHSVFPGCCQMLGGTLWYWWVGGPLDISLAEGPLGSVQIGLIERTDETFMCRILYECKFS